MATTLGRVQAIDRDLNRLEELITQLEQREEDILTDLHATRTLLDRTRRNLTHLKYIDPRTTVKERKEGMTRGTAAAV